MAGAAAGRRGTGKSDPHGKPHRKLLSPTKRRIAVEHVRDCLGRECVSELRACRVLDQPRSTQCRKDHVPCDEPRLVRRMVDLASDYGRYGFRKITAMLREKGWRVNHKRIERLSHGRGLIHVFARPFDSSSSERLDLTQRQMSYCCDTEILNRFWARPEQYLTASVFMA